MAPTTTATSVAIPAIPSTNVGSLELGLDAVPSVSCSILQSSRNTLTVTTAAAYSKEDYVIVISTPSITLDSRSLVNNFWHWSV